MLWDPDAPDFPDTASGEIACAPGEIRRLSSGKSFVSLAEALADAHEQDGFCLGEGEHEVELLDWMRLDNVTTPPSLRLVGAGSTLTTLAGPSGVADNLVGRLYLYDRVRMGTVELEGLRLEGLSLYAETGTLRLTDVALYAESGRSYLAALTAPVLEVQGLSMVGCGALGVTPLVMFADGTITDLVISDNQLYPPTLIESYGDLLLVDPVITGNAGMNDEIGYVAVTAYGDIALEGGQLSGNTTGGPLIHAWQQLRLDDVTLEGNRPGWRGLITMDGPGLVEGGVVQGNIGGSGAFELTAAAVLQLDGVDFGIGEDRNEPCDVALNLTGGSHTMCLVEELGDDATVRCDIDGCS